MILRVGWRVGKGGGVWFIFLGLDGFIFIFILLGVRFLGAPLFWVLILDGIGLGMGGIYTHTHTRGHMKR